VGNIGRNAFGYSSGLADGEEASVSICGLVETMESPTSDDYIMDLAKALPNDFDGTAIIYSP
jgi:hypothetical protein